MKSPLFRVDMMSDALPRFSRTHSASTSTTETVGFQEKAGYMDVSFVEQKTPRSVSWRAKWIPAALTHRAIRDVNSD